MPVVLRTSPVPTPLRRLRAQSVLVAAIAGLLSASFAARADETTAAGLDWRPRSELPAAMVDTLPAYCRGAYVDPLAGRAEAADSVDGQPVTASARQVRYQLDSAISLAGDVQLSQGGLSLSGERARYEQSTGLIDIVGPVTSRNIGVLLTGDHAVYDVNSGFFDLTGASFLFHDTEMRGTANRLFRPEDQVMAIEAGYLTTCAPDRNDWSLVASSIRLDREAGFGTARHVRLQVRDVPVFYWPWASFPIDDRRKTGFLYPSFGTANTGSGGYLSTPYYLNLAPHYDATVTPQYIHGRGLFTEVEGRYLSRFGESVVQLGYIDRDSDYQDEHPGDSGERWALDFQTRATFGGGWQGYGDYSVVSDDDYLSDLNRTLDIANVSHLERRGGVVYQDAWQRFDAYLSGYQTVTDTVADSDKPYQQLPELIYSAQGELAGVEFGLDSQYTHFDRDNDGLTGLDRAVGQRIRLKPEVALPLRSTWGYVRPSLQLDQTWYELDDYDLGDSSIERSVPVAQWDSGLYLDRQTRLFGRQYLQSLEPRLYHAWADAEDDQQLIPNFDTGLRSFRFDNLFRANRFVGGDRVGDTHQTTVALTSRFHDLISGAERASVSLGQVYYHDDRRVTLDGRGGDTRSDSPLAGELVLRPLDTLDLRVSGLWDPRSSDTEEGRSQLVYHSPDYRYLASLGHTYSRGGSEASRFEQLDVGAMVPVTDRVSLIGRWVYDSQLDRTVGTLAGLEYNNCCWSFQLVSQNYLTDDRELDNRLLFQVQLKGIGGSGGSGSTLSNVFYGYEERERRRFGTRR